MLIHISVRREPVYIVLFLKTAALVVNSVDSDQMLHSAASDPGLHCLIKFVCPNTVCYYSINRGLVDSKALCIRCHPVFTKTYLRVYNFDPLKPHFYIVKMGFTGVYIIFLISAQNIDCGYSLELPHRGSSNEYPQSMFWAELWKISEFFIWKFSVFGEEIFYIFE